MTQVFVPQTDSDQTKRIQRHPRYVDDNCALNWVIATPQAKQFADNPRIQKTSIYTMVVMMITILPPDGFRPNQAHTTSPMVCGWSGTKRIGSGNAQAMNSRRDGHQSAWSQWKCALFQDFSRKIGQNQKSDFQGVKNFTHGRSPQTSYFFSNKFRVQQINIRFTMGQCRKINGKMWFRYH